MFHRLKDRIGVRGALAILVLSWLVGQWLFSGDYGALRLLTISMITVAALPLHYILYRWLGQVWLCTGALAMLGAYTYAILAGDAAKVPSLVALLCAGSVVAVATAATAWFVLFLRPVVAPVATVVLHLTALSVATHSRLLGGSDGLRDIPSLAPALFGSGRASPMAMCIGAIPILAALLIGWWLASGLIGARLRAIGEDPVLFESLGGRRVLGVLPIAALFGGLLGLSAGVATSSTGSCAPTSYGILISLLPIIAIEIAAQRHILIAPIVVIAVLALEHLLGGLPTIQKATVAAFIFVSLMVPASIGQKLE